MAQLGEGLRGRQPCRAIRTRLADQSGPARKPIEKARGPRHWVCRGAAGSESGQPTSGERAASLAAHARGLDLPTLTWRSEPRGACPSSPDRARVDDARKLARNPRTGGRLRCKVDAQAHQASEHGCCLEPLTQGAGSLWQVPRTSRSQVPRRRWGGRGRSHSRSRRVATAALSGRWRGLAASPPHGPPAANVANPA